MLNAAGSATPQGLGTAAAGTSVAYSREDHVHAFPTLSGDVTNTGAAVTVAKIQSSPVATTAPASGQVLTWDGASWAPLAGDAGVRPGQVPQGDRSTRRDRQQLREPDGQPDHAGAGHRGRDPGRRTAEPHHAVRSGG